MLELRPSDPAANFYLAQLYLALGNFKDGWPKYESRWLVGECQSRRLKTLKPIWNGEAFDGRLYVWAEQGIGDQILHASMFENLNTYAQKIIISTEKKLLKIFQRSFPNLHFIDKNENLDEAEYDQQIPMASLGQYFRKEIKFFKREQSQYLRANPLRKIAVKAGKKVVCGIAWNSANAFIGKHKSMALMDLTSILQVPRVDFINLQYGDTKQEIDLVNEKLLVNVHNRADIDLYNDIDGVLSLVDACDIVITTSNSIAHVSGAMGKETILLLPFSVGKFWYWHELNGSSLWYPTVKIFKQLKQGDWSDPVIQAGKYLEKRFAI